MAIITIKTNKMAANLGLGDNAQVLSRTTGLTD